MTITPEGVNSVGEAQEWKEIGMAMDSAATETVTNEDMLTSIGTFVGEETKRGVQYEVASGSLIPNYGEEKFMAVDSNGLARHMASHVCDVNTPLLRVSKIVPAENKVVLSKMEFCGLIFFSYMDLYVHIAYLYRLGASGTGCLSFLCGRGICFPPPGVLGFSARGPCWLCCFVALLWLCVPLLLWL